MKARGSTLLEVALAVALLAASGMGLVATQLSLSRHGQSAAMRGQAAFIADAFAEMAIEVGESVGAGDQWKTRTPVLIAGSAVSTEVVGAFTSSATVSWPVTAYGSASTGAGTSAPCAGSSLSARRDCVSLVFVR
ncbi:MAG TPA: hypothetical protein VGG24_08455 [Paraburkholderia sp.]|jgi:Tfp pilus assembly protein PilV